MPHVPDLPVLLPKQQPSRSPNDRLRRKYADCDFYQPLPTADDKERRPDQIELLFDAETPDMAYIPVGVKLVIGGHCERVNKRGGANRNDAEGRQSKDDQHKAHEAGENAESPPNIEPFQANPLELIGLAQQESGDQKAAYHEKNRNSQTAILREGKDQVPPRPTMCCANGQM